MPRGRPKGTRRNPLQRDLDIWLAVEVRRRRNPRLTVRAACYAIARKGGFEWLGMGARRRRLDVRHRIGPGPRTVEAAAETLRRAYVTIQASIDASPPIGEIYNRMVADMLGEPARPGPIAQGFAQGLRHRNAIQTHHLLGWLAVDEIKLRD